MSDLYSWYKSYYLNLSLLIFSIGFLFKVSAAPFHFWSPETELGKSCQHVGSKLVKFRKPPRTSSTKLYWKYISGWTNYSCIGNKLEGFWKERGQSRI